MRAIDKFKYGAVGAATLTVAAAILLTTGLGQAAAAGVTQVFVTNKPSQPVPVQQQGSLGTVSTVSAAAALNLNVLAGNYLPTGAVGELIVPTQASINLTSLTAVVGKISNFDPWIVRVDIATVPNGTTAGHCFSASTHTTLVQVFDLFPGTTATLSPVSPLVFAPPPGETRCMFVQAFNDGGSSSSNTGTVAVSATGYVVSGTYTGPHGTN